MMLSTNPTYSFSDPVVPAGDGSISDLNSATGSFTYTAPDATFTGTVPVQYTVSDGTNSTTGDSVDRRRPSRHAARRRHRARSPEHVTLTILNLTGAVQDIAKSPTYTFSDLRVVDGGGAVPAAGFDDSSTGVFHLHATHCGYSPAGPHRIFGQRRHEHRQRDRDHPARGDRRQLRQLQRLAKRPVDPPRPRGPNHRRRKQSDVTFSSPTVPARRRHGRVHRHEPRASSATLRPVRHSPARFPVEYTVSDGTNSTSGVLNLTVAPLITSPLLIPVALQTAADGCAQSGGQRQCPGHRGQSVVHLLEPDRSRPATARSSSPTRPRAHSHTPRLRPHSSASCRSRTPSRTAQQHRDGKRRHQCRTDDPAQKRRPDHGGGG